MEKLKKFNTKEEYLEWKDSDDYSYPNVCKVADEIVYNDYPDPFWIEDNTNGFTAQQEDGATAKTIKFGDNYVLLSGNKVLITDKVILNTSYTIGQPTQTTTEEE